MRPGVVPAVRASGSSWNTSWTPEQILNEPDGGRDEGAKHD
jgi:hypothetical protein